MACRVSEMLHHLGGYTSAYALDIGLLAYPIILDILMYRVINYIERDYLSYPISVKMNHIIAPFLSRIDDYLPFALTTHVALLSSLKICSNHH